MTPTLAQALSQIAPAYNAAQHERAAERMMKDMEKTTQDGWKERGKNHADLNGPTLRAFVEAQKTTPIGTDINGREIFAVEKRQDLIYANGKWKENAAKTTHTPGPWHATKGDTLNPDRPFGIIAHDDAEGPDGDATQVVAEVCDGPTAEADARLIESAPDLLAALENLYRAVSTHGYGSKPETLTGAMDAARAAIARAKGGAQ